ncbi:MAG: PTS sugar transporter subunit IIA [Candidatus Cloacimonetes bacterium]|jgi:mannitol/fructose-specific phosphotransferase system IIA component (Ntr-type)|nr:PTS sugar transporter subunit IIA [Candidatus Cloacimonadota bacterium]MDD4157176.1 PTS sugar transporter subunit IIA [Candidatus Cloacimonadota bacterium]
MNIFDLNLVKTCVSIKDKDTLLKVMVDDLHSAGYVDDKEGYYNAVKEREDVLSTGIGHGIAIPHGRHSSVTELKSAVYILKEDLEYEALDNNPVRIIFMLAVPAVCTSEYMKVLGYISKTLHDEDNRNLFLESENPGAIFDFLKRMQDEI